MRTGRCLKAPEESTLGLPRPFAQTLSFPHGNVDISIVGSTVKHVSPLIGSSKSFRFWVFWFCLPELLYLNLSTGFALSLSGSHTTAFPMAFRVGPEMLVSLTLFTHWTPATASRRVDDDSFSSLESRGILASKIDVSNLLFLFDLFLIIGRGLLYMSDPNVLSACCIFAAIETIGVVYPAFGEDGNLHGDAEFDVADDTIATLVLSIATTASSETEFTEQHRIATLEDFGIGDAGIGHVGVNAIRSVPGGTSTRTSGDGFVVAEAFDCFFAICVAAN